MLKYGTRASLGPSASTFHTHGGQNCAVASAAVLVILPRPSSHPGPWGYDSVTARRLCAMSLSAIIGSSGFHTSRSTFPRRAESALWLTDLKATSSHCRQRRAHHISPEMMPMYSGRRLQRSGVIQLGVLTTNTTRAPQSPSRHVSPKVVPSGSKSGGEAMNLAPGSPRRLGFAQHHPP